MNLGKKVIMGRRKWKQIGSKMKGRENIVIKSDEDLREEGEEVVGQMEDEIEIERKFEEEGGVEEICVIGGGKIYVKEMKIEDRLKMKRVIYVIEGDKYFNEINKKEWKLIQREDVKEGEKERYKKRYMM